MAFRNNDTAKVCDCSGYLGFACVDFSRFLVCCSEGYSDNKAKEKRPLAMCVGPSVD